MSPKRNSSVRSLARGLPQGLLDFGELVEFVSEQATAVAGPAPAAPVIEVPAPSPMPNPVIAEIGREVIEAPPEAPAPTAKPKRSSPKRARISFEVPARLNAKLERMARALDRTKTTILRDALVRHLNNPLTSGGDE